MADSTHEAAIGQSNSSGLLGANYEIVEHLASGGMGRVLKVRHRQLNQFFAAKVLSQTADPELTQRLLREARILCKLKHPNIVGVHAVIGDQREGCVLVMDYLEGDSLASLIKQGRLSLEDARQLAIQICDGLHCAHQNGILHRDLKPANVMVVEKDGIRQAKLIDFGIAKSSQSQRLTRTGTVIGSPVYMSPEQIVGKPVDARSDIYSMGCLLYELLCGSPPFAGENAVELAAKHTMAQPQPPSDRCLLVAPGLDYIVLKCLEKDPGKRYQDAQQLKEALENPDTLPPPRAKGRAHAGSLPLWKSISIALLIGAVVAASYSAYIIWKNASGRLTFLSGLHEVQTLVDVGDRASLASANARLSALIQKSAQSPHLPQLDTLMARILMLQGQYTEASHWLAKAEGMVSSRPDQTLAEIESTQRDIRWLRCQLSLRTGTYADAIVQSNVLTNQSSTDAQGQLLSPTEKAEARAICAEASLFNGDPHFFSDVVTQSQQAAIDWQTLANAHLITPGVADPQERNALLLLAEGYNCMRRFKPMQSGFGGDDCAQGALRMARHKVKDSDPSCKYPDAALSLMRLHEAEAEYWLGVNDAERAHAMAAIAARETGGPFQSKNADEDCQSQLWVNWVRRRLVQLGLDKPS